ncbi:MAG: trypsin-like peptidase domain-containing protein [bacterium]|nr:trypsin-like peptidase domain-containing protein [bacterium]
MRGKIVNSIVILLTLTLAFILGGGFTYYLVKDQLNIKTETTKSTRETIGVIKCDSDISIDETGISTAVGEIYDATVTLQNYQREKLNSTGSGFVYKKDNQYGYILTNHHVVEGSDKLIVTMSNDDQIEGEVLGSDAYLDLAVVRIDVEYVKQVAKIGTSSESNVGDTVFTVGSPVGYQYRGSVTRGTLSGKNRMVTVSVNSTSDWVMNVLQIDAAINPGNSGGPLLNVNGEVIGINSLKLVEDEIEGMGFAIPMEYAMKFIDELENGKEIERPLIGINMLNVTDIYRLYQYNIIIDPSIESGVVVVGVVENSSAAQAGLQKGDIITGIGGKEVTNAAYLKYLLYQYEVGDTIQLTYIRDKKEKKVSITLTKMEN